MRLNYFFKASILLLFTVILLSACSSMKGGKHRRDAEERLLGTQTQGVNLESGLNDQKSPNRLKAPFDQVYYFGFDRYDVNPDDVESINVQARYLIENAYSHPRPHVRIEGHADERGSREYNVALGWRRAQAVANIMKQQGVSANMLSVVSYGKEKPFDFGHSEEAYRLNRRVNLIYEVKY